MTRFEIFVAIFIFCIANFTQAKVQRSIPVYPYAEKTIIIENQCHEDVQLAVVVPITRNRMEKFGWYDISFGQKMKLLDKNGYTIFVYSAGYYVFAQSKSYVWQGNPKTDLIRSYNFDLQPRLFKKVYEDKLVISCDN